MNAMKPIRLGLGVLAVLMVIWACTISDAHSPSRGPEATLVVPSDGAAFQRAVATLREVVSSGDVGDAAAPRSALISFVAFFDAFAVAAASTDDYEGPDGVEVVADADEARFCSSGGGRAAPDCFPIEAVLLDAERSDRIEDVQVAGVWLSDLVAAPRAERVGAVDRGFAHHRGSVAGPDGTTLVAVQVDAGNTPLSLPARQWRFTADTGGFWTPHATIGPERIAAGESAVVTLVLAEAPLIGEVTVLLADQETGRTRTIDLRID